MRFNGIKFTTEKTWGISWTKHTKWYKMTCVLHCRLETQTAEKMTPTLPSQSFTSVSSSIIRKFSRSLPFVFTYLTYSKEPKNCIYKKCFNTLYILTIQKKKDSVANLLLAIPLIWLSIASIPTSFPTVIKMLSSLTLLTWILPWIRQAVPSSFPELPRIISK